MSSITTMMNTLPPEQKTLYKELISWKPEFKTYCKISQPNGKTPQLHVEIPSPTGDPDRRIIIWIDDGDISLGFGPWHVHGPELFESDTPNRFYEIPIIDLIKMIISGDLVYFVEVGTSPPFSALLNPKQSDAIAAQLTSQYSSGIIDIYSWDGSNDRRITLENLKT